MTNYSNYSDDKLLELLRSGDHIAYKEVYNRYWLVLYRHALRMLENKDDAKDVVQDIFVMVWSRHTELNSTVSLSSYLYASTRNRILNMFKRNRVSEEYLLFLNSYMKEQAGITDYVTRERNLASIIESEVALLPERMRQVFELKRKQHLSYKEIAQEMQISDLTVKTQMNKALKILKLKLGTILTLLLLLFKPF